MCNVPGAACKTGLQGSEKRNERQLPADPWRALGIETCSLLLSMILLHVAAGFPPPIAYGPKTRHYGQLDAAPQRCRGSMCGSNPKPPKVP